MIVGLCIKIIGRTLSGILFGRDPRPAETVISEEACGILCDGTKTSFLVTAEWFNRHITKETISYLMSQSDFVIPQPSRGSYWILSVAHLHRTNLLAKLLHVNDFLDVQPRRTFWQPRAFFHASRGSAGSIIPG